MLTMIETSKQLAWRRSTQHFMRRPDFCSEGEEENCLREQEGPDFLYGMRSEARKKDAQATARKGGDALVTQEEEDVPIPTQGKMNLGNSDWPEEKGNDTNGQHAKEGESANFAM